MFESLRYYAASALIVTNLTVVTISNIPEEANLAVKRWSAAVFSPQVDHKARVAHWALRYYGHLIGIDNRWQMFGRQSRFNWRYVVQAEYSDGRTTRTILLPIPSQSARTISQRLLFDCKENKILLNLYNNEFAREAYSRYLARTYPKHEGLPIRAVVWELAFCHILPPEEAIARRKLRQDATHVRPLNRFEIAEDSRRATAIAAGDANP